MTCLRSGWKPGMSRGLCAGPVLLAAICLSGCGSSTATEKTVAWQLMPPEQRQPISKPLRDLEDDGMPAQTPPPLGVREKPDDPSQPWSPNYGVPPEERGLRARQPIREDAAGGEALPWQTRRVASSDSD